MRRRALPLALVAGLLTWPRLAPAHVGSPDVFFEGDAGPYHLLVTVRMPQVIPGIATIEVRADSDDVRGMTVVPMRLTGPGSDLPPTPDRAQRSPADPRFFTADLWLMERGSLQVRIDVDGTRGPARLPVPIPAVAQRALGMDAGLGGLLFALMLFLALSAATIVGAAAREGGLEPGEPATARAKKRGLIASLTATAVIAGVLALGRGWWGVSAREYQATIPKPWRVEARVDACELVIPPIPVALMPDHCHDMHVFMVRAPELDRLAHVHPTRADDGSYRRMLPSLPAGRYRLFADIVLEKGFPQTGTGELVLPDLTCPPTAGDDSVWTGETATDVTFERSAAIQAGTALALRFHVTGPDGAPATDVEPYMGMAGHAAVLSRQLDVFAHLHPNGSVAMPALMLAGTAHAMFPAGQTLPPEITFPYGFPHPGDYRIFVQLKRSGRVETAAFDLTVLPPGR